MDENAYIEHVVVQVGERIKDMRADAKMSQEEFSSMAGLERTNYSEIENGIGNPTLKTLCKIILAHGIRIEELFVGIGVDVEMQNLD